MKKVLSAGSPITEFLETSIDQIETGLFSKGYVMCTQEEAQIELNLEAMQSVDKHGNIVLKIIDIGASKLEGKGQQIKIYARKQKDILNEYDRLERLRKEEAAKEKGRRLQGY